MPPSSTIVPGGSKPARPIMSAIAVASIVFACVFGGALLGMFLRAALPETHLSSDAKDVVKLGMGLIATMAALVLGLLIASAKSSYEAQSSGLEQISVDLVLLDGMLAHYGPEAKETRDLLRRTVAFALERVGPKEGSRSSGLDVPAGVSPVYVKILELSPRDDAQRWLHSQALQIGAGLARTRWLLIEEREDSSIPMPFLVVLVFCSTVSFSSFGVF